jgi:3-deoxy-D-manno-octulosonate 8-phosphate phosphatase (KDO 8-P phosphatase)
MKFDPKKFGGEFLTEPGEVQKKLSETKAYIFDWDGVFNDGVKTGNDGSPFSEVDSMGVNMLRFSHWLVHGGLPHCFIITGANNPSATSFAKREHFHGVFQRFINKNDALVILHNQYEVQAQDCAFFFDDILDLAIAAQAGLRFCIGGKGRPMLSEFIRTKDYCDYSSSLSGTEFAVREVCELLISLNGNFERTVEERMEFSDVYLEYLKQRNSVEPAIHAG